MSRYIDADAYIKYCDEHWLALNVDAVNAQPTADVRKVVRCRDCSWHKPNDYFSGLICTNPYFEAEYGYISVDEEFYCANGTTDEVEE